MKFLGSDVQNWLPTLSRYVSRVLWLIEIVSCLNLQSSAGNAPRLFDDVGHGHALVQDTQFAVGVGC